MGAIQWTDQYVAGVIQPGIPMIWKPSTGGTLRT